MEKGMQKKKQKTPSSAILQTFSVKCIVRLDITECICCLFAVFASIKMHTIRKFSRSFEVRLEEQTCVDPDYKGLWTGRPLEQLG